MTSLGQAPPGARGSAAGIGWSWLALALPLLVLILVAATYDRREWRDLAAHEPTVLMAAESLVHDRDLAYERLDFDRHLVTRYGEPRDLALASGTAGRRITFDLPLPVPLWLAPWVAWRPETGFALGQALLLALAAMASAWCLAPTLGAAAPWAVALLVFGSVSFAHVFFATPSTMVFATSLLAAALVARQRDGARELHGGSGPGGVPLFAAGLLVSLPLSTDVVHFALAPLLLVVLWRARPSSAFLDRVQALLPFVVGAGLGVVGLGAVQWWSGGGLRFVGTERFVFRPDTGYPTVGFQAAEWSTEVERLGALFFDGAPRLEWGFDAALWAWNALFLACGENLGLLPYFLPLLLVPALGRRSAGLPWLLAVVAWAVALLVLRPFGLSGGETLANPLFLPLYAASVVVWGPVRESAWMGLGSAFWRGSEARAAAGLAVLGLLLAAPFLGRLWSDPGAPLVRPAGADGEPERASRARGYAYPTSVARALLPEETSQRPLPAGPFVDHMGLRVRLASDSLDEARIDLLLSKPPHRGRLWVVGGDLPPRLVLEMGADAPANLRLRGARSIERILEPGGGVRHVLEPSSRRHNLWWGPRRQTIQRFDFALDVEPEAVPDHPLYFRIVPEQPLPEKETSP